MTAKIKSLTTHTANHYKNKPRGLTDRAFEKVYWPYLPVVIIAGLLLSFSAQAGAIQAAMRGHTKVLDYSTTMTLGGLLTDTNNARSSNGLGSVAINGALNAAAQAQANDMVARNYWSHNSPEGNPPWTWVNAQGYSYQKLGQNLAAGFSDEQATINGWLASPPHRENLLDPAYTDVGFGWANNPDYTSAGGGPMTVIVAFYGNPTAVAAPAPSTPSPAAAQPTPQNNSPAPSAQSQSSTAASEPPAAPNTDATTPVEQPVAKTTVDKSSLKTQPATTESSSAGVTLAYRTSRAQLALAHLPQSAFATGFAIFGLFAVLGLWASRHLLRIRRVLVHGESYVIHHPIIDVTLLAIAGLLYLMTQTVGIIL